MDTRESKNAATGLQDKHLADQNFPAYKQKYKRCRGLNYFVRVCTRTKDATDYKFQDAKEWWQNLK